jgi:hypothetical protein
MVIACKCDSQSDRHFDEGFMTLHKVAAAAIATVALAFAAAPADAAVKKKYVVAGPPAARVTVHRRSFLDPGTETLPYDQHYTDYVYSPYLAPRQPYPDQGGIVGFWRAPLPAPIDLPSAYYGR